MSKEEKKIKYETDTPVQGEYREHALSALGKVQKLHEERRQQMAEMEKLIDERSFNYYVGTGGIVMLDERVLPLEKNGSFHYNVRQHIGKKGVVKECHSDFHAFGRGWSYSMDVMFDGELYDKLPAYYFIDLTEDILKRIHKCETEEDFINMNDEIEVIKNSGGEETAQFLWELLNKNK